MPEVLVPRWPLARLGDLRELALGPPLPGRVPDHVARAIRREQDSTEVLVSVLQLAAIAFFGFVYTLTPKAFPPTVPFEPVPIALGVYLVFTLGRLLLALRRRLEPGLLAASSVVDVAVLMLTIWSFHLQYGEPPAMYLKAPTLMYVFILVALRTLRFTPALVLLTGASAAVGWAILLLYAVMSDPDVRLTRNFPDYVMSYGVLIGAEVDKILSILVTTAVLALALYRARKLTIRAATERQAAADLSRFFAPEIAGRIREQSAALRPGQAEQRDAAILFVDLRGFSLLSAEAAPAAVMELLSEYQACIVGVVRRHGGSIDKFMGDGILASFGASRPSARFAADAVAAIEVLIAEGAAWRAQRAAAGLPAPAVNASLAVGRVMFGAVGDAERLEYTVIGDAVNRAAKLEKHCKVERVAAVITAKTLTLAAEQGLEPDPRWTLRAARNVAGLDQPLDLAVLEGTP